MAEFEADDAANNHGEEDDFHEADGFCTGGHREDDCAAGADADPDCVGEADGDLFHGVAEASHADGGTDEEGY